jgi:hypothetical protein
MGEAVGIIIAMGIGTVIGLSIFYIESRYRSTRY